MLPLMNGGNNNETPLCLCLTQLQRQVFDCFDIMLQFTLIDV